MRPLWWMLILEFLVLIDDLNTVFVLFFCRLLPNIGKMAIDCHHRRSGRVSVADGGSILLSFRRYWRWRRHHECTDFYTGIFKEWAIDKPGTLMNRRNRKTNHEFYGSYAHPKTGGNASPYSNVLRNRRLRFLSPNIVPADFMLACMKIVCQFWGFTSRKIDARC